MNLKKTTSNKIFLLFFLIIISVWELSAFLKIIDVFFFPPPSKIIGTACVMLKTGELQQHILVTLTRFFLGLFFGAGLGLIIGYFCGVSKKINSVIEPLIYLIYPIPRFALLPFITLIFGLGLGSKVFFISMAAFFVTFISTINGIKQINSNFLEVAVHYGARGCNLFRSVVLPGSLPAIFAGFRISIGLALTYTIIVEFLTSSDGIGAMMWLSLQNLKIERLFLGAAVIALFNVFSIFLLKHFEYYFIPWNRQEDTHPLIYKLW